MAEKLLDRVRKSVIAGAQTSAQKLEEAARVGKLRLDLLSERRKLSRAYGELGREAHMAMLEDTISTLGSRPGVQGLKDSIEGCKRRIAELEIKLSQGHNGARTQAAS